ncbi:MAG TPA: ring-cleaving dioxygenase [Chloroflexia bacterium]|nr:ring-cleaving dioxygenase [Chloroflexia bacterium]
MDASNANTNGVHGIHHITAIAGNAQENLDFYAGVLGMRLVKRSVNQDDPGTYHLFYADAEGHPGTDLTFFPWANMPSGRKGYGLSVEVPLAVPSGSLGYWSKRLAHYGVETAPPETRFGEHTLPLRDPHGMELALVETDDPRLFTPWEGSPVPVERQIRGLHAARLWERNLDNTARFLTSALGFERLGADGGWVRFGVRGGGSGNVVEIREVPDARLGQWGVGSVHHIAWRVPDDEAELAMRRQVIVAGGRPTDVIDRFWFKSVYFREPGGVLFEIATDGPGFATDENPAHLGEQLVLPPWLEASRPAIEAALPELTMPLTTAE